MPRSSSGAVVGENQISRAPSSVTDVATQPALRQPRAATEVSVSLRNRTRCCMLAAEVRLANTYLSRLVGLLGKGPNWAVADRGLWIIPSRGVHTLGMRFAIDVIFLDRNRSVVHIHQDLRPWRVSKVITKARSVVELPPGTIARTHTEIGDEIEIV